MELFLPSLLVLLIAAGVVFLILPKFGPAVLAILSIALLAFGVYQHMNTFGTEYRLSTWQTSYTSFTPFLMLGAVFVVIIIYYLFLSPLGLVKGNSTAVELPEIPSLEKMPSAESATNALTEGINKGLNKLSEITGMTTTNKPNNKKNNIAQPTTTSSSSANSLGLPSATQAANKAANAVINTGKNLMKGIQGAFEGITGTGSTNVAKAPNVSRLANNLKKPNVSGEPRMVSGLPIPLTQV